MTKYLTTSQYLLLDDSMLSAQTMATPALDRLIRRAETLIDSYVGFDPRFGGFEHHTAWYEAPFDDRTLRVRIPNFPVPVTSIDRYRIQVSNMNANGNGFFANINPADCVINPIGGYVEIVPLQAITYSMTPFMLGLGLQPPLTQIDYHAGFYFGVTGAALDNPSGDLKTYYAANGFWATSYDIPSYMQPNTLPPTTPQVYLNGSPISAGFTLDTTEGTVTFTSANLTTDKVTLDYTYTIPSIVRDAMVAQINWLVAERDLNLMGMANIEVARNRDQQIKRHIRSSGGASAKDEPAIASEAMQLLQNYVGIPFG